MEAKVDQDRALFDYSEVEVNLLELPFDLLHVIVTPYMVALQINILDHLVVQVNLQIQIFVMKLLLEIILVFSPSMQF